MTLRHLLASAALATTAVAIAEPSVIPRPAVVEEKPGTFAADEKTGVSFDGAVDEQLLIRTVGTSGLSLKKSSAGAIVFRLRKAAPGDSPEAYALEVTDTGVVITGDSTGLFYGAETLAQMIAGSKGADGKIRLGLVSVADKPRYGWRGYMLDESRHFSGETAVLRLIDAMARYKLNRLHWHLTDSPGWRIEIKKYPKLTSVGSKGSETDLRDNAPALFYTQEQIRRIVAYARSRGVVIVPEIDMPGHADAAVKAYPENDGGGFLHKGETKKWPHFTFNPAKPETLAFLDDVLTEVAALFPQAGVIHFGGDEVNFGWKQWPDLPEVKSLMAKENLKDNAAVETWFNRRMATKINALGFDTGGWDEIASRGLPKDRTVVFWWRHDKPQVMRAALDAGMKVVLCPRRPLYFDFIQNAKHKVGRTWSGFNPISDVYDFPAKLNLTPEQESHVLGVQACLWTEGAATQARRDFMTWPRLVAVAESGWTPASRKDYASFSTRLQNEIPVLKAAGITPYDPFADSPEVVDPKKVRSTGPLDKPE